MQRPDVQGAGGAFHSPATILTPTVFGGSHLGSQPRKERGVTDPFSRQDIR